MPKGWKEAPSNGGGTDFFDLKKDGDKAVIVLKDEPYILDTHRLPDPNSEFGKQFPCGMKDRNSCPICEQPDKYDHAARKVTIKAYYAAYVQVFSTKAGQQEEINAMKVISGGARLHEGFMACYRNLVEFGGEILGKPLIISRSGEKSSTTYNVQPHPKAGLVIETPGDVPDVEAIAGGWLEKAWQEMGWEPTAGGLSTPAGSPPPAEPGTETDPFADLSTTMKGAR